MAKAFFELFFFENRSMRKKRKIKKGFGALKKRVKKLLVIVSC